MTRSLALTHTATIVMRLDAFATEDGGEYNPVVKSGDFYTYFMQGRCPHLLCLLLSFSINTKNTVGYGV